VHKLIVRGGSPSVDGMTVDVRVGTLSSLWSLVRMALNLVDFTLFTSLPYFQKVGPPLGTTSMGQPVA
jgi:hypothetical protein